MARYSRKMRAGSEVDERGLQGWSDMCALIHNVVTRLTEVDHVALGKRDCVSENLTVAVQDKARLVRWTEEHARNQSGLDYLHKRRRECLGRLRDVVSRELLHDVSITRRWDLRSQRFTSRVAIDGGGG